MEKDVWCPSLSSTHEHICACAHTCTHMYTHIHTHNSSVSDLGFNPRDHQKTLKAESKYFLAWERSQQLRALAALAQDLHPIPSAYMAAHNALQFQSQGIQCPLSGLHRLQACMWYADIHAGKTPISIKDNETKTKNLKRKEKKYLLKKILFDFLY